MRSEEGTPQASPPEIVDPALTRPPAPTTAFSGGEPDKYQRDTEVVAIKKRIVATSQTKIEVMEDTLRLILNTDIQKISSKSDWIAPLGILVSLLLTILTSDFNDKLVSSKTLDGFAWAAIFASAIWLAFKIKAIFVKASVDGIIEKLKKKSDEFEEMEEGR